MKNRIIVATTDRLQLSQFSLDDAENFYHLNLDPDLLTYTGDKPFDSPAKAKQFIQAYDQYQQYGIGRWSVYLKGSNQYIGFCGLRYCPTNREIDIGFRIAKKYWNKGYATEAALASLTIGFNHQDPKVLNDKIIGRAMLANGASHAVLTKLGMIVAEQIEEQGQIWQKYQISKTAFINKNR